MEKEEYKYLLGSPPDSDLLLELINTNNKRKGYNKYNFQGIPVPRVNEILDSVIGKSYLQNWAANLGYDFKNVKRDILITGSIIHEKIDLFLLSGHEKAMSYRVQKKSIRSQVNRAYFNFVDWYNMMTARGYVMTPLAIEQEVTCPWYGGTIDCIMNFQHSNFGINRNYVVDFKSSKSISSDYLLQCTAYMWAWNWCYDNNCLPEGAPYIRIDGFGVIRVDKEKHVAEDIFIDSIDDTIHINNYMNYLYSMINWYYCYIDSTFRTKLLKIEKEGKVTKYE